jgi:tetratricopeptide (TPR) repeat protein
MTSGKRSLQDRIRERQRSGFIGRQGQVIQYQENFAFPVDDERRRFLFNIHGDAGVGKTFLARQMRQTATAVDALTAYVDETVEDVTSAMSAIAEQFSRAGRKFGDFEKRVAEYQKRRHELESDPQAPVGVAAFVTKTAVTIGLAAARDIPVAGSILAPVDPVAAADQVNQVREYLAKKFSDHRDVRLLLSPADELTPVFLADLNNAIGGRAVALFFDTYEVTGLVLDRWLRSLYAGRYGDLPETLVTTISGQKPLDPNLWGEYLSVIADIPLEPFSEAEARQFLGSKGITDEPTIQVILTLSGRLPLWLATLADARAQGSADLGDPSGEAVERFLKWEGDPARRETAMVAALPRALNQDVLAVIRPADEARELFGWLRGLPFVARRGELWVYHDVVRAAMLRLRRAEAPVEWRAEQNILAQANARWASEAVEGTDITWANAGWVDYKREEIYHLLCGAPEVNLPGALTSAVKAAELGTVRARQWAALITDAGRDADNHRLREWGKRLVEGAQGDNLASYLTCLINDGRLDKVHLVVAYEERGVAFRLLSRYDDALADFNRAIELDPEDAWAISLRGAIYHDLGHYDEAFADASRAVELRPKSAQYITSRGEVRMHLDQYDDALADFSRAIELNPKYARAFAHRGDLHKYLRHYEESLADYNRAIELAPKEDWIMVGRAGTYHDLGRYDDALAELSRAIELDPKYARAFARRGDVHRHLGHYEESLADYNRAIELAPDNVQNISQRGEIHRLLGQHDDALADFNRASELFSSQDIWQTEISPADDDELSSNPHTVDYVSLAIGLIFSGRRKDAASIFAKLRNLRPGDADALNNYAFCLIPDNPETALELLDQASQISPVDELLPAANRMRCLLHLNRQSAALAVADGLISNLGSFRRKPAYLWSTDGFTLEDVDDARVYIIDLVTHIVSLSNDEELSRQWEPILAKARAAVSPR